ncbi:MAG: hypothetical protein KF823_09930 [Xanthomonadales bacterium]|nr:hypothetical protein [Xanthomonadales bacterium]
MACNSPALSTGAWHFRTLLAGALGCGTLIAAAVAQQIDIAAPPGSDRFGTGVHLLGNGNIVVRDCGVFGTAVGSVSLYRPDGELISTLTGAMAGDCVGSHGIREVGDGNFIVLSPHFRHQGLEGAGAVTWVDGDAGLSGEVSAANSLVGSSANDRIGEPQGILVLGNGNYIVQSTLWDNGDAIDAGAVVWADGDLGVVGPVSADNALVGTRTHDAVGSSGGLNHTITELPGGDFVVRSPLVDLDGLPDAGAVTFGSGSSGVRGVVGDGNSLVGSHAGDQVGGGQPILLAEGRYVLRSPFADRDGLSDVGALTWIDGPQPLQGAVDPGNSLFGMHPGDRLGEGLVQPLANGNLAVGVPRFGPDQRGAVLLFQAGALPTGILDPTSALLGSEPGDRVGSDIKALPNGHFVTATRYWRNGAAANAGAVTWVDGWTGLAAEVGTGNSLVGSLPGDTIAESLVVLPDSRYVVVSPYWSSPTSPRVGAISVGDGLGGLTGPVSAANSLVGAQASDLVGFGGATVLANGNVAILSPRWANGDAFRAGAVTWMSPDQPVLGPVSAGNSLVGSTIQDGLGMRLFPLANGNLVVGAPAWDHGDTADVGAITWIDGSTGRTGAISPGNSLIGANTGDFPINSFSGSPVVWPLANGNYVVNAPGWDGWGGLLLEQGAVVWGDGRRGVTGVLSPELALVGTVEGDGVGDIHVHGDHFVVAAPRFDGAGILNGGAVALLRGGHATIGMLHPDFAVFGTTTATGVGDHLRHAYDPVRDLLVVGRPADRVVSLLRIDALLVADFD